MAPSFCRWLWHSTTLLCDGTITCGLDDPFKLRDYGNIKTQTLTQILHSPGVRERRRNLLQGQDCGVCHLHTAIDDANIFQLSPSAPYPYKAVIESSIRCNIRCNNSVCNIANDASFHVRTEDYLKWDVFKKFIDEVGPHLRELFFFNYGEPFINPKAADMLAYARQSFPQLLITSSTNGILLAKRELADRIVAERLIDWLCFTIGGSDNESYGRYHKSASFEKAIQGMRNIAEAKKRLGVDMPTIHWRYLLFRWNDSTDHIRRARELAEEIGVDEFKIFMTGTPLEGRSLRRAPGTAGFEEITPWLDYDAHFRVDPFAEAGLWAEEKHPALGSLSWTSRAGRVLVLPEHGRFNIRLARPDDRNIPASEIQIKTVFGAQTAVIGGGMWADNIIPAPDEWAETEQPLLAEIVTVAPFTPLRHGIGLDGRELGVMVSLDSAVPQPNPFRREGLLKAGPRLREGC